ncbi:MAG: DUF3501 family protein [Acidimicrobiaceae bacterium]|nr:DUF3501 family protein [Acidimicrobiaceae bacterium]
MTKLQLSDIVDLREYERQREDFRKSIIALKYLRRISLGDLITVVFENRETIRFQIQEMARAEKMLRDEQIETELAIYNPMIPEKGELKATLFLELTSKDQLQEWLPALVGIEKSVYLEVGTGSKSRRIKSRPESEHESQLTREDVTASVHYIQWILEDEVQTRMIDERVFLGIDHHRYNARVELSKPSVESLISDWRS